MSNAKIDENRGSSALAITNDANETITNFLVDSITGRLLITTNTTSFIATNITKKIDENRENVALLITNDTNEDIKPILVKTSGELLIDLIFK